MLGLPCCTRALSSCRELWLLSCYRAQPSRCGSFSCCSSGALERGPQYLELTDFVAPQHVESPWTRDWTHVLCTGRQILNHWTTKEVLLFTFGSTMYGGEIKEFPKRWFWNRLDQIHKIIFKSREVFRWTFHIIYALPFILNINLPWSWVNWRNVVLHELHKNFKDLLEGILKI